MNDNIKVTLISKEVAEREISLSCQREEVANNVVHFPLESGPWMVFTTLIPPRLILGTLNNPLDADAGKPEDKD